MAARTQQSIIYANVDTAGSFPLRNKRFDKYFVLVRESVLAQKHVQFETIARRENLSSRFPYISLHWLMRYQRSHLCRQNKLYLATPADFSSLLGTKVRSVLKQLLAERIFRHVSHTYHYTDKCDISGHTRVVRISCIQLLQLFSQACLAQKYVQFWNNCSQRESFVTIPIQITTLTNAISAVTLCRQSKLYSATPAVILKPAWHKSTFSFETIARRENLSSRFPYIYITTLTNAISVVTPVSSE